MMDAGGGFAVVFAELRMTLWIFESELWLHLAANDATKSELITLNFENDNWMPVWFNEKTFESIKNDKFELWIIELVIISRELLDPCDETAS